MKLTFAISVVALVLIAGTTTIWVSSPARPNTEARGRRSTRCSAPTRKSVDDAPVALRRPAVQFGWLAIRAPLQLSAARPLPSPRKASARRSPARARRTRRARQCARRCRRSQSRPRRPPALLRLDRRAANLHVPLVDRIGRERARLEEPGRPQPFVDAQLRARLGRNLVIHRAQLTVSGCAALTGQPCRFSATISPSAPIHADAPFRHGIRWNALPPPRRTRRAPPCRSPRSSPGSRP